MSDLLGEALARLDRTVAPNVYRPDIEPILAAARKWHALTNPTDKLIDGAAKALHDAAAPEFDVDEIPWEECHELYQMDRRLAARVVVEALISRDGQ